MTTASPPLTMLLDQRAHRYAQQFAAEQATPSKGKQVYLNTLAVCAVRSYLQCLSVPTALDRSDCWHPGMRAMFDIADLVLPRIGKLECRPLLPDAATLVLPAEATENRMGCVAVRLEESLDRVQLLGFLPAGAIPQPPEPIPLAQLQSLDTLIDTLHRLRLGVQFRHWFEGIFAPEWQPAELLLAGRMLRTVSSPPRDRDTPATETVPKSVSRGKLLCFDQNGAEDESKASVILIVKTTERSPQETHICLGIYPLREGDRLPSGLHAIVLDEQGNIGLEAQAKDADDWIQLEFSCAPQEAFSTQVTLGDTSLTERFSV